MSMFFSDLDNTLIYSHRRNIGSSKVVVEHLGERHQSFMTEFSYDFFSAEDWLHIIPVTTRTEQQYKRIECASALRFKYAIVCNGGKLLVDGEEDETWSYETYICTRDNYDCLNDATEKLSFLCNQDQIHTPSEYFSYVRCGNTEQVYQKLLKMVDNSKVNVQRDGSKVYIFANGVTKGSAIERFMKNKDYKVVLAAGDNLMDVSMLNKADFAFVSPEIYDLVECPNKIKIENALLSDGICKEIIKMRMKGIL